MKILIAVESHFKEYGGPYTAITQEIEYLNSRKISNKLIFRRTNHFTYNLDLEYIINDYDLVHIYGIWRPFLIKVYYIAKKLKKKIIISPIGALEPWALSQKKLKKKIAWHLYQKKILNNVDVLHATSDIEADNIKKNGISSKIEVIGHGLPINNDFILKRKLNKKKKILFFSRIHNKKGLLELISIWKNLKNKLNWELHIYGPVSDQYFFKQMMLDIKKFKLENCIFYLGSIFELDKKKKIFIEADGFILPSKSENFGISIGEALSFGLPVLTTFQTPWKIINSFNAGYVFNFSKQDIQSNVDKFMELSDEERYKMGLNALKLIKDKFDYQKTFKLYENLYKKVLS